MKFIDLKAQQNHLIESNLTLRDKINKRIKKVLDDGNFIQGPEVTELEGALKKFTGSKYCISTASGTDSLLIALLAIGLKPGDEVITTPFSFISTSEIITSIVFTTIISFSENLDKISFRDKWQKYTR